MKIVYLTCTQPPIYFLQIIYLWNYSLSNLFSEPIQSRCAVLRYSKLSDAQLLSRLLEVCKAEDVSYTDDGLEAIIFTAQGDMRQVVSYLNLLNVCSW